MDPLQQAMHTMRWREREAKVRLAAARGTEVPSLFPSPADLERFAEVRDAIDPTIAATVAAHLARGVVERELAAVRERLASRWGEPVQVERDATRTRRAMAELWAGPTPSRAQALLTALRDPLSRDVAMLTQARAVALRRASDVFAQLGTGRHPDAGPNPETRRERAAEVLSANDLRDAALEILRAPRSFDALTRALRDRDSDRDATTRDRYRRLGQGWGVFESTLSTRVRVDASHRDPRVEPHVLILDAARDIRILPSPIELGWQSERAAARGVGRALALMLAQPPVAFSRPTAQSVARAFGELGAQMWADEARSRRSGLASRAAATRRRLCAARTVLELRLHAASVEMTFAVPRSGGWEDRGEDLDSVAESLVLRALGVSLPAPIARLLIATPSGGGARLRALQGALRMWVGLRERFDEDWYRNPHIEESVREFTARGGGISIEAVCEELAPEEAWRNRLAELLD